jgi:O-antigen/teichoic acid export membrane protein
MLNFVDFGLGVGMQKAMATAFGRDETDRLRRTFFSGTVALAGLGVAALLLGLPIALLFNWGTLLKIQDPALHAQAGTALAITIAAFAIGLPFNSASRLAMAVQRGWLHAGWIALGSLASLAVVALAARGHWSFLAFLALTTVLPALQSAGLWLHLRYALHWQAWKISLLPHAEWRALAGDSLLFAVPQAGLAFVQAAPPLALSLAAGPVAATAFNLLQRLYSPVTQGQIMFLTPLWPAVTEAHVRGDAAWVHRAFRQSLLVALGAALALVGLTWQSAPLLHWWVGAAAVPAAGLLAWLTCGWFVAQIAWQPLMYLLVGIGRLKNLAVWSVVGLGLSLGGMAAAVAWQGGETGVLAAALAGLAVGGLPGLAWACRRALQGKSAS